MANETIEVLRRARGYVEQGWTQGALARDAHGAIALTGGRNATCWCCHGALDRAERHSDEVRMAAATALRSAIGTPNVSRWNDAPGRTQAEALAAFDRAIALVEAEG
jgi:hypothetical protein